MSYSIRDAFKELKMIDDDIQSTPVKRFTEAIDTKTKKSPKFKKEVDIEQTKGTIANVLTKNMNKINAAGSDARKMREIVIELLQSDEIIGDNKKRAQKAIMQLSTMRFPTQILGFIGTLMSGIAVNKDKNLDEGVKNKEESKRVLKEGYVGQTVEDFLEYCAGPDAIDSIVIADNSADDYTEVFTGSYDELRDKSDLYNADFADFDCGSQPVTINVSKKDISGGSWYETIGDFIEDFNGDEIVVYSVDDDEEIFSGYKEDLPEEFEDYYFTSFDAPSFICINISEIANYDDDDDYEDDDLDEAKKPKKELYKGEVYWSFSDIKDARNYAKDLGLKLVYYDEDTGEAEIQGDYITVAQEVVASVEGSDQYFSSEEEASKALEDCGEKIYKITLNEAKKSSKEVNTIEESKKLTEEFFDANSEEDIIKAAEILDANRTEEPVEMIIDLEANSEEDIKDSYVGDVILKCNVCNTLIYKKPEEVIHDEENPELCNKDEECVHCNSKEGYEAVGQVAPIASEEPEEEVPVEENPEDRSNEENPEEESEDLDESLNEGILDLSRIVKDSYSTCLDILGNKGQPTALPTAEMVAEDIVNNYEGYGDIDLSNPSDYNKWVMNVKQELIRQGLDFAEDLDDLDESLFNSLANKYLNSVYENIDSFTTTNVNYEEDSKNLVLEGVIKFKSGKTSTSSFKFESKGLTKRGKLQFIGSNESFSKSPKAFKLIAEVKDKKLCCESLTYNYGITYLNEAKNLYGRVINTNKTFRERN